MAGAVYWVGADGNVWFKDTHGVRNVGQPLSAYDKGFDTNQLSAQATRIADPNAPRQSAPAPSNPNGGGSGSSVAPKPDRTNDINLQLSGLGAVDQQYSTGIAAIDKALGNLKGQYSTEATANEKNYSTQSDTNQNNLQKNKQTALVNAAQGRQGLFGTLASLGALNGSGIDLANRAVQNGANADLTGAADNYSTNQNTLDTAIGQFRQENNRRNKDAEIAAENSRTNAANQAAQNRMAFYSNLSKDYADMGDAVNASKYSGLASSLYPELAKTSVPNSNIAYSGAAFTPGTLADYMAGANSTQVTSTPTGGGSSIPGLIATPTVKRKQLQTA